MDPSLTVTGSVNVMVFEAYLEQALLPHLRPGRIVVMDNLSAHKSERVRELIEGAGCEVLYLPPYSPDYNPIEEAFSEIKGLLVCYARHRPELGRLWWRRWARRSTRSPSGM